MNVTDRHSLLLTTLRSVAAAATADDADGCKAVFYRTYKTAADEDSIIIFLSADVTILQQYCTVLMFSLSEDNQRRFH